jgi:hypothetical protein
LPEAAPLEQAAGFVRLMSIGTERFEVKRRPVHRPKTRQDKDSDRFRDPKKSEIDLVEGSYG